MRSMIRAASLSLVLILGGGCQGRPEGWLSSEEIKAQGVWLDPRLSSSAAESVFNLVAARPDLLSEGPILDVELSPEDNGQIWVTTGVIYGSEAGGGLTIVCSKTPSGWEIVDVAGWVA